MSDGFPRPFQRRNPIRFLGNGEPTLDDLMNDPIAALLRQSDNITLSDVRAALRKGAGGDVPEDACRGR
jgi:hypothetical protein